MFFSKDKARSAITLLLYEDLQLPKCFEIRKSSLKFLLFALPSLVLILSCVIIGLSFSIIGLKGTIRNIKPEVEKHFLAEKLRIQNEFAIVKNENNTLLEKLKAPQGEIFEGFIPELFRNAQGQKDLRKQRVILIESLKASLENQKLNITFDLINPHPEQITLRGHILLLIQDSNSISFYPRPRPKGTESEILRFDDGESFTISRFRPFKASLDFFTPTKEKKNLNITVLIFSRVGDLLYKNTLTTSS